MQAPRTLNVVWGKEAAEQVRQWGGDRVVLEGDNLQKDIEEAQRFHNHSQLDFEKLKGDPDNIEKHLVSYINVLVSFR